MYIYRINQFAYFIAALLILYSILLPLLYLLCLKLIKVLQIFIKYVDISS